MNVLLLGFAPGEISIHVFKHLGIRSTSESVHSFSENRAFFIENNVRCAILHKSVFEPGRQYVRGRVVEYWNLKPDEYSVVEAGMLQLLGSPTFEDDDIAVFDLTRAWPDTPGAGSGDHSVQSMDLGTW